MQLCSCNSAEFEKATVHCMINGIIELKVLLGNVMRRNKSLSYVKHKMLMVTANLGFCTARNVADSDIAVGVSVSHFKNLFSSSFCYKS